MNFIWNVLLEMKIQKKEITFIPAKRYSPYMEVIFQELNMVLLEAEQQIEINPYYRFYSIFKNYFPPGLETDIHIKTLLFDILIYYLAILDIYGGNNKQEYYKNFVLREIKEGFYGETAQKNLLYFTKEEKESLAKRVLNLYQTGYSFYLFQKVIKDIFPDCFCYRKQEKEEEILLYIGVKREQENQRKLETILQWFLPIRVLVTIYWENHFCILGVPDTSILGKIALY